MATSSRWARRRWPEVGVRRLDRVGVEPRRGCCASPTQAMRTPRRSAPGCAGPAIDLRRGSSRTRTRPSRQGRRIRASRRCRNARSPSGWGPSGRSGCVSWKPSPKREGRREHEILAGGRPRWSPRRVPSASSSGCSSRDQRVVDAGDVARARVEVGRRQFRGLPGGGVDGPDPRRAGRVEVGAAGAALCRTSLRWPRRAAACSRSNTYSARRWRSPRASPKLS